MKKMYKHSFTVLFLFCCSLSLTAQNAFFSPVAENAISISNNSKRVIIPSKYQASTTNITQLRNFLWSLPSGKNVSNRNETPVLELPMPDGSIARFHVWESSIMEPGLAAKFPEMKTFAGQGITDPYATIRFDYSPYFGFSAQILSAATGRINIDPYARGDVNHYMSYYTRNSPRVNSFVCDVRDEPNPAQSIISAGPCRGTQLYKYRLALACTGEYAVAVAGPVPTVPAVAAAMLIAVNRVNGVYETETSITMELVMNNNNLIYLDGNTDPYTNNNGGAMLSQNIATCNSVIGSANYDIGHVFSTGGGGVAFLGCICTSNKAGGVTGLPNPVGDPFYIDYVAHEMGHQYGGSHTFNSVTGSCSGNRSAGQAYEVGSATTIQGYAGICGSDNIQPNSDPFFHTISFDQIGNYAAGTGGTCANITSNGNSLPVITAMNNNGANIPISTPFTLSATATDANPGDVLSYCWEQWDLGPAGTWNSGATSTTQPLFKSRIPKTTGERTIPDINVILAGYPVSPPATMGGLKGETLPTVARPMKFRLTVRDNRAGGGGVVTGGDGCQAGYTSIFQINTIATPGPFAVTVPNGGEIWAGGSTQTVTWNVVNSDLAPINCANVKISLSTDGGFTYPTVIMASTPNDGSESITVPTVATTTARIKVEAVGNIFFDISNANFEITASCVPPGITTQPNNATTCVGNNVTYTIVASGSTPLSYQWQVSTTGCGGSFTNVSNGGVYSGATTASLAITGATAGMNGYAYRCVVTGCSAPNATSNCATLTVNAATVITAHPSNVTVCEPTAVAFSVGATGTSLTYQWQVSTNGGGSWNNLTNVAPYSNVTTATMNINPTSAGLNGYQYRCVVSSACSPLNSNVATLTVNAAPGITAHPVNASVCAGNSASFSITASGGGLVYQWQESTNGGGTWNNLVNGAPYSGVGTATLTINPTVIGMNNYQYRCVVTGSCPGTATSNAGVLTVGTALVITQHPNSQTICATSNVSFTVAATGTVNSYQWQESTNGGGSWNNISNGGVYSGATTATLTLTNVPASFNNNQYRCVLTGACPPINSNAAILTVNALPTVTSQPAASTICAGSNTSFAITATGTGISYQWQLSTTGCGGAFNNIANGGVYGGATTNTLSITGAPNTMDGYAYRCVVTGTCAPAANSNCVVLTVNTAVTITNHPAASVVCAGSNTSFSVTATGTTPAYQWQESTNGGGSWNNVTNGGVYGGATTNTLNLTGVTAGMNNNQYRCVVTGAAPCGVVNSNGALLTVNTAPFISTQPVPGSTVCGGQNTSFTVVATGTSITYQWQLSTDGGTIYNNITNGGVYSGATTATLSITGATPAMSTYKYRCVISGTCSPAATTAAATLTVFTPINITSAPVAATQCATGNTSFSVAASGTGPTYQWQESTNGGTTWNSITNGGIYSGATTTTLTLTGITSGMNNYRYRCVVIGTAPCGAVNSADALLTVNPKPVVTLSAAPLTTLLPGKITTITANVTPSTGYTLAWTYNGSPLAVSGNSYTLNVEKVGTYSVVATLGPCVSDPASITIDAGVSKDLFIFPTPNNGNFTVSYINEGAASNDRYLRVVGMLGQIVYSEKFTVTGLYTLKNVNLRNAATGDYVVQVMDMNQKVLAVGKVQVR